MSSTNNTSTSSNTTPSNSTSAGTSSATATTTTPASRVPISSTLEGSTTETGSVQSVSTSGSATEATPSASISPSPSPPPSPSPTSPFASSSLYVGELHPDVVEGNLFDTFNQVGPVASIRVCRDAVTRRSLGYAYVNYHSAQDAERALEMLNNSVIRDRPCRIMWSQRDPSLRKSGKGNIFIKNLDKSIDHKALYDTFCQFGPILSCKIELDENNESKGYGYIQFLNQESADTAVNKVNGMMLNDKKVFVGPFVSRKERLASNSPKKFTNVYVNNLDTAVDEDQLKNLFQEFGIIQSAVIMKDESGKSRGFGFVNFESPESAQRAVEALNNKEINGKQLYVGRAQKKMEREHDLRQKFEQLKIEQMSKYQGVNLYIKNLDDDMDDDKLRSLFDSFGTITSAKIMRDTKGHTKGFGFVCYSTPEEATKAATEMNGKMVGSKPLYVSLAQKKDQRRAQLEASFQAQLRAVKPPHAHAHPPQQLQQMAPLPLNFVQPRVPYGMGMYYGPQTGSGVGIVGVGPQPPAGSFVYPTMPMVGRGGRIGGPFGSNFVMVGPTGSGRGQGNMRGQQRGYGRGGRSHRQHQQGVPPASVASTATASNLNVQSTLAPTSSLNSIPRTHALPDDEQKQLFGEQLYVLVSKSQPQLTGKITGMILESCHIDELFALLENHQALDDKIAEAIAVLRENAQ